MSDETGTTAGGLGQPSKRGRPRKAVSGGGVEAGTREHTGGVTEPHGGVEDVVFDTAAATFSEPGDIADPRNLSGGDGGDKPRRGRKPGGKNRPKEEAVSNLTSLLKIEKILVTGAFFLANIAETPELMMEPEQAKDIREAIEELTRLYPIGISEKKVAWTNFCFALGGWVGPGVVAWYKKPAKARPRVVPTPIRQEPDAPQAAPEPGPYAAPIEVQSAAMPFGPEPVTELSE